MSRVLILLLVLSSLSCREQKQDVAAIDYNRFNAVDLLWDLRSLSQAPAFSWIDSSSTVLSLVYESIPFKGNPTQVFAYYSNPDILMGRKTDRTFPGVVLVHGGGGTAFKEWVEKWAADGYAAIAMDLGGKDANGKRLPKAGPDQTFYFKFNIIEEGDLRSMWSYHSVANVILAHSLLLNLPEVDANRTCVTGISWGGYLTCIAASLDNRFKAAVPVYGCAYYREREYLSVLTPADKEKWLRYFDPARYMAFASPAFLLVNGNTDRFFNIVPYQKTFDLLQTKEKNIRITPNMLHSHPHGWQPVEIRYFFESVLNDGVPLPHAGQVVTTDSTVEAGLTSVINVHTAKFYYSSDTLSANEARRWSEVKAEIDPSQKRIRCEKPDEDFKYGFFYVTDCREVSVSSPLYIR